MAEAHRSLRSSEVAKAVGLSAASIQAYARAGRIPYRLTPGRQYRFNLAEVRELLAREPVRLSDDLPDVFTATGPLVDALSGYRADPINTAAEARLRARAARPTRAPRRPRVAATDGARELTAMIARAGVVAVAVLHRDPAAV